MSYRNVNDGLNLKNNTGINVLDSGDTNREIINYDSDDELNISNPKQDEDINIKVNDGGSIIDIMTFDAENSRVGIKEENPDAPVHITGTNQGGDLSSIDSETLLLLQNNADPTVSYGISAGMEFVGGYEGGGNIYSSTKCGGVTVERLRKTKLAMLAGASQIEQGFYSESGGSYYSDIVARGTPGNSNKIIQLRMTGDSASTDVHTDTTTKKIYYVTCATETKEILEDAKLEEMLGLLNIPIKKYKVKDDPEQKEIYGIVLEDLERFCPHLVGRGNKEIENLEEIENAKKAKEKDDTVQIPEEKTKLVGKNTSLIVDNLIGICQYQQKKIEELEQRVSKLEGAK